MTNLLHQKLKFIIVICILFIIQFSHASTQRISIEPSYPELNFSTEYKHIVELISDIFVEKGKITNPQVKVDLIKFIYKTTSVNQFEKQMISEDVILIKGNKNKSIRDTKEYIKRKKIAEKVARNMSIMVVSNTIDIYKRKILKPDLVTKQLFEFSNSNENDQIISWLKKSVTIDTFKNATNTTFQFKLSDKLFHYKSPDFSWRMSFGREGYVIFRNNKLVENIPTSMN